VFCEPLVKKRAKPKEKPIIGRGGNLESDGFGDTSLLRGKGRGRGKAKKKSCGKIKGQEKQSSRDFAYTGRKKGRAGENEPKRP